MMAQAVDKQRDRRDRIARLKRRLASVAEDDAKQNVTDPVVSILKGVLDLMADETS